MLLTRKEIVKIEQLGYNRKDFAFKNDDGFYQLKNRKDSCFFLKDNKCVIYDHRPQGCRFYPIVYDLDSEQAILDDDCPLIHTITNITLQKFSANLKKYVKKLFENA